MSTVKRAFYYLISIILIYFLVIFQTSILNYLSFFSLPPNLIIVLALSLYLTYGHHIALYVAFFAGIIYDVLSLNLIGSTSLILLLIIGLFSFTRRLISHLALSNFIFLYVMSILYRYVRTDFKFDVAFFSVGLIDLGVFIILTTVLRSAVSLFHPSTTIQLKFEKL